MQKVAHGGAKNSRLQGSACFRCDAALIDAPAAGMEATTEGRDSALPWVCGAKSYSARQIRPRAVARVGAASAGKACPQASSALQCHTWSREWADLRGRAHLPEMLNRLLGPHVSDLSSCRRSGGGVDTCAAACGAESAGADCGGASKA